MIKRAALFLCVLMSLTTAAGWIANRWQGLVVLCERRVGPGLKLLVYIKENTFFACREHTYQLRVGEQPPPNREFNA